MASPRLRNRLLRNFGVALTLAASGAGNPGTAWENFPHFANGNLDFVLDTARHPK